MDGDATTSARPASTDAGSTSGPSRSCTGRPSRAEIARCSSLAGRASYTLTSAPASARNRARAMPDRAKPRTLTGRPRNSPASSAPGTRLAGSMVEMRSAVITSAQPVDRRQEQRHADQPGDDADDPEAEGDL